MPPKLPKWKDLKKFCEKDGWELKRVTKHYSYVKQLPTGDVLRTSVSKSLSSTIPERRWHLILKKQLGVTSEEFWSVVKG